MILGWLKLSPVYIFQDKYEFSLITIAHYQKLILRSLFFLLGMTIWIYGVATGQQETVLESPIVFILLLFAAVFFCIEMISRLLPSPIESMGCEKQFHRNLKRSAVPKPILQSWKKTFAVVISWVVFNGTIGFFYLSDAFPVIDTGFMYVMCLAYAVCDMICILFFCPFQTWIMKNKCCGTCRMYNWDYAMMFTPLVFVVTIPSYIVLGMALFVLVVWEYRYRMHPERFSEATNENLSCKNCKEKLCRHKKQLSHYLEKNREELHTKGEFLTDKLRRDLAARQKAAIEAASKAAGGIKSIWSKEDSKQKNDENEENL